MNGSDKKDLFHRANKIDLQDAVLIILRDKVEFAPKGSTEHVTVQFGTRSKALDLHRTIRTTGGEAKYETLFRMPHDQLVPILESAGKELIAMMRSWFRPLRIGWMARHRIWAEPGFPPTENDWEQITLVRKKRLYVDEAKFIEQMGRITYLDELLDLPDGRTFSVIECWNPFAPKPIGIGIKGRDKWGNLREFRTVNSAIRHGPIYRAGQRKGPLGAGRHSSMGAMPGWGFQPSSAGLRNKWVNVQRYVV